MIPAQCDSDTESVCVVSPAEEHGSTTELISEIRRLKRECNAVVLAHYYMTPELQRLDKDGGVADYIGDSLALSRIAMTTDAEVIVFCGVQFMAETAKVLNPTRTVLLPSRDAGCSLASSITAADVRRLREQHPGVPVIAYINTYAETKAEVDICCTSRNAFAVAASFPHDTLLFVPDVFMGRNLQKAMREQTGKELLLWHGTCEVHEQFTGERLGSISDAYPQADILVHWEVPDETVDSVLAHRPGIVGSTSDIINYVGTSTARQFILGSECDLGAALRSLYRDKEFITPCVYCPHMKHITLHNTLAALQSLGTARQPEFEMLLPQDILERAYLPIKRMMDIRL